MLKGIKVVFRNGVFVPTEEVSLPEGTQGFVVYCEPKKELPGWWGELSLPEEKKGALKTFSERLKRKLSFLDLKVVEDEGSFEVFLVVHDENSSLKPALEEALRIYEETGVYIPLQVISEKRLIRWKETGSPISKQIERGVSIL
jgi:predicted DNA-binding antitoxin AbrB/MazE fold protein